MKNFMEKEIGQDLVTTVDRIGNMGIPNQQREEYLKSLILIMDKISKKKSFQEYLEKITDKKKYDGNEILFIEYLLRAANIIYNNTEESTGLSDSEYDILLEIYTKATGGKELPITPPLVVSEAKVQTHKYTLHGTLSKIYKLTDDDVLKNDSQRTIEDWVNSIERVYNTVVGEPINFWDEDVYVFMKYDGISVQIEYDEEGNILRALTRGDVTTNEAVVITDLVREANKIHEIVHGVESDYPFCVKYEAVMENNDLEKYNEEFHRDYKNTRSAAASIINNEDIDLERIKYLRFIPHRYSYMKDGVESRQIIAPKAFSYPNIKVKLKNVNAIREFAFSNPNVYNKYRCDGAVIRLANPKLEEILGIQDHKPRYEVAYKFTEEKGYSKVENIEFQVGLFGRITPVVVFEPIKLKGNTIKNAAISYKRFLTMGLCKGDICKITYDIIPYILFDENDPNCKRSGNKKFKAPKICPECGSTLEESSNGGYQICVNPDCNCRKKGKILNYIIKIGIEGISYETVNDLYNAKYLKNIPDLYKLASHKKELIKLEGYGKKKIEAILNSIEMNRTVSEATFLGSLGIEGFGIKRCQQLLDYINYEDLIDGAIAKDYTIFEKIPGFKEKTVEKFIEGINENEKLIEKLEKELELVNVKSTKRFTVAFTNIRDKELEEWIKEKGGGIDDSVTKDTNLLIVPDGVDVSSAKTVKAKKYGIPIIGISDVKDHISKNF